MSPFQGSKTTLNNHQAFIAAGCIFQGDSVILGLEAPLAIVSGRIPYGTPVNFKLFCLGHSQIPLESPGTFMDRGYCGIFKYVSLNTGYGQVMGYILFHALPVDTMEMTPASWN